MLQMKLCSFIHFVAGIVGLTLIQSKDDEHKDIKPDATKIVIPEIPPPKVPVPSGILDFTKGQLCVVGASADVVLRSHPEGVVKHSKKKYPNGLTINGVFVDGNGEQETREYVGPYIILIEPVKNGYVEIDVIPLGLKKEKDIVSFRLNVKMGVGPQPPPDPAPNPKPTPDPKPKPTPVVHPDAWFIVVEDMDKRTPEIALTLDFKEWDKLGVNYRFYSKTSPDAKKYKFDVMAEQEVAKGKQYPVLLALTKDGDLIESNTLPPTFAGARDIVKRISGK